MDKTEIKTLFNINPKQEVLLDDLIDQIQRYNKHTNLVGRSTLVDPWRSHILDTIQIKKFIKDKKKHILDMGTGAGFPGLVLSIMDYQNVTLVDSNGKKINFLKIIKKSLNLGAHIKLGRLEKLDSLKYDIITSRALARLNKLFTYSQKFIKKNTVLIFLKGKTVNDELIEAKKIWSFHYEKHKSLSDHRGCILVLKNLKKHD